MAMPGSLLRQDVVNRKGHERYEKENMTRHFSYSALLLTTTTLTIYNSIFERIINNNK